MRLLVISADNPFTGRSGVSMYCRGLLPALVDRGIELGALCVEHRDWRLRAYVRSTRVNGVTLFSVVNSPLFADNSILQPGQDCHQATLERLVGSCLQHFQPDLVHIQTLQGYPASIISLASDRGIPTVVTLHDFWVLCPRMALVRLNEQVCDGPGGGHHCVQFCVRQPSWRQRLYRFGRRLPEGRLLNAFLASRAWYRRSARRTGTIWTPVPDRAADIAAPAVAAHARRLAFLVGALADADRRLAVSEFVRSTFVRHGLRREAIDTLPPALELEGIAWRQRRIGDAPLRFGFLGRAVPMKGVQIFARAVRDLGPQRAEFHVFGDATPDARRYLQDLAGQAALAFHGSYTRRELGAILDGLDVVVLPSIVPETVGLVSLEAQAAGVPVIGSRLGAIPEQIRDGQNGLLFAPGDPDDLRRKMRLVIETPSLVAALSARTSPPSTLRAHVDALLDIYTATLEKGRDATWIASTA